MVLDDVRQLQGPVNAVPALVVRGHGGRQAPFQNGLQHTGVRFIGLAVGRVGAGDSNTQGLVGLLAPPAGYAARVQSGGDNGVGQFLQRFQGALDARVGGVLGLGVPHGVSGIHGGAEVAALDRDPAQHALNVNRQTPIARCVNV